MRLTCVPLPMLPSYAGLTRVSIIVRKASSEKSWIAGSSPAMTSASLHRRVHQAPHLIAQIHALPRSLRHEHREQFFRWVDPEERAGHAAPEELPDRSRKRRHALMRAHGKTEPEAVARGEQRAADLHAGVEMVGCHCPQRLVADDSVAVERASAEQHLAEPRIVHRGRDEPAAA